MRKLIELSDVFQDETERGEKSFAEIVAYAQSYLSSWSRYSLPSKSSHIADYFANHLKADIDSIKNYATRITEFNNLDQHQFFNPGLYVIGATPANLFRSRVSRSLAISSTVNFPSHLVVLFSF